MQDKNGVTPLCKVCDKYSKMTDTGVPTEDEETNQLEVIDTLVGVGGAKTVFCCKLNPVLTAIRRGKYIIARYLA